MAKKYNYSLKRGDETFSIDGCDSFDEAVHLLEKGIYQFDAEKRVREQTQKPEEPTAPEVTEEELDNVLSEPSEDLGDVSPENSTAPTQ